jgi:hypothetical protein
VPLADQLRPELAGFFGEHFFLLTSYFHECLEGYDYGFGFSEITFNLIGGINELGDVFVLELYLFVS